MIALLTYDRPHRKSQDVAVRLHAAGLPWSVVRIPWVDRILWTPLFPHRPHEPGWPCEPIGGWEKGDRPVSFFRALGCMTECWAHDCGGHLAEILDALAVDAVVIGGAQILPPEIVERWRVINVHPGLLPASRGLDVLKWAVRAMEPVGVTAHLCDREADLGRLLIEKRVPVFDRDDWTAFALRQYEAELDLFVPAVEMVTSQRTTEFPEIDRGETEARRRMPKAIEARLPEWFEAYKRIWSQPLPRRHYAC